mmetsp:Transcript_4175/g.17604  ORF Transcript_4175/g.17604 Transcript_4175/m.17604 type:complete len:209 (-) Transcript_4175:618-1244(-)
MGVFRKTRRASAPGPAASQASVCGGYGLGIPTERNMGRRGVRIRAGLLPAGGCAQNGHQIVGRTRGDCGRRLWPLPAQAFVGVSVGASACRQARPARLCLLARGEHRAPGDGARCGGHLCLRRAAWPGGAGCGPDGAASSGPGAVDPGSSVSSQVCCPVPSHGPPCRFSRGDPGGRCCGQAHPRTAGHLGGARRRAAEPSRRHNGDWC